MVRTSAFIPSPQKIDNREQQNPDQIGDEPWPRIGRQAEQEEREHAAEQKAANQEREL